jgi:hypothetical protein
MPIMDGAVWGFIGVVIGGLITGLVSYKVESLRAITEAALDSAKRQDDRRIASDAFQRENLLVLQDAFDALTAIEVEGLQLTFERVGKTGRLAEWPADMQDRHVVADRLVRHLMHRVKDDHLRATIDKARDASFDLLQRRLAEQPMSPREFNDVSVVVMDLSANVSDEIGEVLRRLL